ncbi:MAG: hypothetical protein K0R19_3646, partial [Bacillota bacterium]|nr:hypothetical protein [Bacillota bacterium]
SQENCFEIYKELAFTNAFFIFAFLLHLLFQSTRKNRNFLGKNWINNINTKTEREKAPLRGLIFRFLIVCLRKQYCSSSTDVLPADDLDGAAVAVNDPFHDREAKT